MNKISIIIITKDNLKDLIKTLKCLSNSNIFQIIVIDGSEFDQRRYLSKEIISKINVYIQEKDDGIYDAMNKGIRYCSCEWSMFINSGDILNSSFIEKIQYANNFFKPNILIYGNTLTSKSKQIKPDIIKKIKSYMPFCHQSVIYPTNLLKKYKFDLRYHIGSDYDQLLRMYNDNIEFKWVNYDISTIDTFGTSNKKKFKTIYEWFLISKKNMDKKFNIFLWLYDIIFYLFASKLK